MTGYVLCSGCGLDTLEPFCGYCIEYATAHAIDLTQPLSATDKSALFHNVEDSN